MDGVSRDYRQVYDVDHSGPFVFPIPGRACDPGWRYSAFGSSRRRRSVSVSRVSPVSSRVPSASAFGSALVLLGLPVSVVFILVRPLLSALFFAFVSMVLPSFGLLFLCVAFFSVVLFSIPSYRLAVNF